MGRRAAHITLVVVIWLLIGAAVNVLVAWGMMFAYRHRAWPPWDCAPSLARTWPFPVPGDWPDPDLLSVRRTWWSDWAYAVMPIHSSGANPFGSAGVVSVGTPWRTLVGWVDGMTDPRVVRFKWSGVWLVQPDRPPPGNSQLRGGIFLPVKPLWPSFALNAVFYGAVTWVIVRRVAPRGLTSGRATTSDAVRAATR